MVEMKRIHRPAGYRIRRPEISAPLRKNGETRRGSRANLEQHNKMLDDVTTAVSPATAGKRTPPIFHYLMTAPADPLLLLPPAHKGRPGKYHHHRRPSRTAGATVDKHRFDITVEDGQERDGVPSAGFAYHNQGWRAWPYRLPSRQREDSRRNPMTRLLSAEEAAEEPASWPTACRPGRPVKQALGLAVELQWVTIS